MHFTLQHICIYSEVKQWSRELAYADNTLYIAMTYEKGPAGHTAGATVEEGCLYESKTSLLKYQRM